MPRYRPAGSSKAASRTAASMLLGSAVEDELPEGTAPPESAPKYMSRGASESRVTSSEPEVGEDAMGQGVPTSGEMRTRAHTTQELGPNDQVAVMGDDVAAQAMQDEANQRLVDFDEQSGDDLFGEETTPAAAPAVERIAAKRTAEPMSWTGMGGFKYEYDPAKGDVIRINGREYSNQQLRDQYGVGIGDIIVEKNTYGDQAGKPKAPAEPPAAEPPEPAASEVQQPDIPLENREALIDAFVNPDGPPAPPAPAPAAPAAPAPAAAAAPTSQGFGTGLRVLDASPAGALNEGKPYLALKRAFAGMGPTGQLFAATITPEGGEDVPLFNIEGMPTFKSAGELVFGEGE